MYNQMPPMMSFSVPVPMNPMMGVHANSIQMNPLMPPEFNTMSYNYQAAQLVPDEDEIEAYNQWKKLCLLSELYNMEETKNYKPDHPPKDSVPQKQTVDKYLNYLMNIPQPEKMDSNYVKLAISKVESSKLAPAPNQPRARPIFQHDKVKHSQKRQQWIQDNEKLVEELAVYAAKKKEIVSKIHAENLKLEKAAHLKRLEHQLEEDEKAREIAKLHGLNGEEIVTEPVPTFEGLKDIDLEAERKADLMTTFDEKSFARKFDVDSTFYPTDFLNPSVNSMADSEYAPIDYQFSDEIARKISRPPTSKAIKPNTNNLDSNEILEESQIELIDVLTKLALDKEDRSEMFVSLLESGLSVIRNDGEGPDIEPEVLTPEVERERVTRKITSKAREKVFLKNLRNSIMVGHVQKIDKSHQKLRNSNYSNPNLNKSLSKPKMGTFSSPEQDRKVYALNLQPAQPSHVPRQPQNSITGTALGPQQTRVVISTKPTVINVSTSNANAQPRVQPVNSQPSPVSPESASSQPKIIRVVKAQQRPPPSQPQSTSPSGTQAQSGLPSVATGPSSPRQVLIRSAPNLANQPNNTNSPNANPAVHVAPRQLPDIDQFHRDNVSVRLSRTESADTPRRQRAIATGEQGLAISTTPHNRSTRAISKEELDYEKLKLQFFQANSVRSARPLNRRVGGHFLVNASDTKPDITVSQRPVRKRSKSAGAPTDQPFPMVPNKASQSPREKQKATEPRQYDYVEYVKYVVNIVAGMSQIIVDMADVFQRHLLRSRIEKLVLSLEKLRKFISRLKKMNSGEKDKRVHLDIDMFVLYLTMLDDLCVGYIKIFMDQFKENQSHGKDADFYPKYILSQIEIKKNNILANISRFRATFQISD